MMNMERKEFGKLGGTLYSFDEVGDKLPMHNHDESSVHITFVLNGSFRIHGDGWDITAIVGQLLDWQAGQAHEFIALEPNSRFLNIVKGV
jgi:quercetin dioxygenase-like cupin family protein